MTKLVDRPSDGNGPGGGDPAGDDPGPDGPGPDGPGPDGPGPDGPGRGDRRRADLVEAGLDLLAESGWPAVTSRLVAARAGANVGLVHYHFGGMPRLRVEIARRATDLLVRPVVDELVGCPDPRAAGELVRAAAGLPGDDRAARLAVEITAAAIREPEVGQVLREAFVDARRRIADWLGQLRPHWTTARRGDTATLLTAALDGLLLHRMLDRDLAADGAVAILAALLEADDD
ncbi:TetR/AcrR family transcriptional regulator [Polymorphospora sp. NPDC050346]|uniref:TetR/AcrR family transcriptional regulator n=1 Tax=Polymorphospora sp. NPDC050346 TaxID=3155780 RepID=UPI0033DE7747